MTNELKIEAADLNRTIRGSMARPIAGLMLCKHGGLSQRAAAELLCYGTGAALSMQLKRLRAEIQSDKKMARQVSRIENVITSAGELTGTNGVKPERRVAQIAQNHPNEIDSNVPVNCHQLYLLHN